MMSEDTSNQRVSKTLAVVTEYKRFYENCEKLLRYESFRLLPNLKSFCDSVERGPFFSITVWGPTNSGKSTFLNYFLNKDPETYSRIFLMNANPETSLEWTLEDNNQLPAETVRVSHIDNRNLQSPYVSFNDMDILENYLIENYSREKIKKLKEVRQTIEEPYRKVIIEYGTPSEVLHQRLLETRFKLNDVPGLDDLTRDEALLTVPSILVYCFDYGTGFFGTTKCTALLEKFQNIKPTHVVFLCTNIENYFRKLWNHDHKRKFKRSDSIDYSYYFPKVRKEIEEQLQATFLGINYSLFFFDPSSEYEPIAHGIVLTRDRLLDIRDIHLTSLFVENVGKWLKCHMHFLKDDLYTQASKTLSENLSEKIVFIDKFFDGKFARLKDELYKKLKNKLQNESNHVSLIEEKLRKMIQERKEEFRDGHPNPSVLKERIATWIQNKGLNMIWTDFLANTAEEFRMVNDPELEVSLREQIESRFISDAVSSDPEASWTKFEIKFKERIDDLPLPLKITSIGVGILIGIPILPLVLVAGIIGSILYGLIQLGCTAANYSPSFTEITNEIVSKTGKVLKLSQEEVDRAAQEYATRYIVAWEMGLKRRLTAFYASKFALPKEQIENYFKNYQIDVQQLDKLTESLDKI